MANAGQSCGCIVIVVVVVDLIVVLIRTTCTYYLTTTSYLCLPAPYQSPSLYTSRPFFVSRHPSYRKSILRALPVFVPVPEWEDVSGLPLASPSFPPPTARVLSARYHSQQRHTIQSISLGCRGLLLLTVTRNPQSANLQPNLHPRSRHPMF